METFGYELLPERSAYSVAPLCKFVIDPLPEMTAIFCVIVSDILSAPGIVPTQVPSVDGGSGRSGFDVGSSLLQPERSSMDVNINVITCFMVVLCFR